MVPTQSFCSCFVLLLPLLWFQQGASSGVSGFVRTNGTRFVINNRTFYPNGFNAYWLMIVGSDPAERGKVSSALQQASDHGMNLVRTWAFSDGGNQPLQHSPGSYNEAMFKGLDFAISEANKFGVHLMLSLVNNYGDFGGKRQYVEWGRERGVHLTSHHDDEFYRNAIVKQFYKDHVQRVLTRVNTITGVAYKDDPTIFAWELINEPRCETDLSGRTLQLWIHEMAAHVKSIDNHHLLEVGLEGFYGDSTPERSRFNPGTKMGTDFVANNMDPAIDFATIHAYPDQWMAGSSEQAQLAFLRRWIGSHSHDAGATLGKPLMITEFGRSSSGSTSAGTEADAEMIAFFGTVYGAINASAAGRKGGACAGGLFWQLLMPGMDEYRDGYEIIFSELPTLANFTSLHSLRMSILARPSISQYVSK